MENTLLIDYTADSISFASGLGLVRWSWTFEAKEENMIRMVAGHYFWWFLCLFQHRCKKSSHTISPNLALNQDHLWLPYTVYAKYLNFSIGDKTFWPRRNDKLWPIQNYITSRYCHLIPLIFFGKVSLL